MKNNRALLLIVSAILMSFSFSVFAEETTGEKVQTGIDKSVKDTKRSIRKLKRKTRNAVGNKSAVKDAKDGLNNTQDEIEFQAKKLKRKVD